MIIGAIVIAFIAGIVFVCALSRTFIRAEHFRLLRVIEGKVHHEGLACRDRELLERVMDSMNLEQLPELRDVLSPPQQALFAEAWLYVNERRERAEARR